MTTASVDGPRALDYSAAASYLGISVRYLKDLVARGEIPVCRLGERAVRLLPEDLDAFLQRRRTPDVVR